MASGQIKFNADNNKTVTVNGSTYSIKWPDTFPEGLTIQINEVEVTPGSTTQLTADAVVTMESTMPTDTTLTVTYTNAGSVTLDSQPVTNGQNVTLSKGAHTMDFVGASTVPDVQINGSGIQSFTVNGGAHQSTELPYTFTPIAGQVNNVYVTAAGEGTAHINMVGTNIAEINVDGTPQKLPLSMDINGTANVAVSGEVYQVDLTSQGGAVIKNGNATLTDGTTPFHRIIDITQDTYINVDATHILTVTGEDIKEIRINGLKYEPNELPATIRNRAMTATVDIVGYDPSEIHITGNYIETVTLDGNNIPVGESGSVDLELTAREENHFVNIIGSQPREYGITWNDNGGTNLFMDGKKQTSGTTSLIEKDVYVSANPTPVPVHIEATDDTVISVDGKRWNVSDFVIQVDSATELDIFTETCNITVDYGDNSYSLLVPARLVTITAPHRDGWIFDGWSSDNVGIVNPKSVKCNIDLTGKSVANLVCHYQRWETCNKPNIWN